MDYKKKLKKKIFKLEIPVFVYKYSLCNKL